MIVGASHGEHGQAGVSSNSDHVAVQELRKIVRDEVVASLGAEDVMDENVRVAVGHGCRPYGTRFDVCLLTRHSRAGLSSFVPSALEPDGLTRPGTPADPYRVFPAAALRLGQAELKDAIGGWCRP